MPARKDPDAGVSRVVRKKLCVAPDDRFVVNVWGLLGQRRGVSGSGAKWLHYVVSRHRPACPSRLVLGRSGTLLGLT